MNAPRATGLAPARDETPQAAQGRSPAGPVTAATSGGQVPSYSVPYRTPQFLAHAMSDPEAMGETASDRLASHYAKPSATHRSFLYEMLIRGIIQPGSGACLTSGPVAGNQEETNGNRR